MSTLAEASAATTETARVPEFISGEADLLHFLKEEIDKSGELYLKVALWKVLLRLAQHCADFGPENREADYEERRKQMLTSLIAHSEQLTREARREGGLDEKKHGISESAVRENIEWLREKLALLELKLMPERKRAILSAFGE